MKHQLTPVIPAVRVLASKNIVLLAQAIPQENDMPSASNTKRGTQFLLPEDGSCWTN